MLGLVPSINVLNTARDRRDVDGRDKLDHDDNAKLRDQPPSPYNSAIRPIAKAYLSRRANRPTVGGHITLEETPMRLKGKTALITGAAQGFGLGIAETFVREGARVAVLDINGDKAREAARAIGRKAFAVACDVGKAKSVDTAVAKVIKRFERLDIVVNNAGISHRNQPMLDVTEAEFDRVFDVNVKSIFLMARATVPHFREHGGGVILNIGSTAGVRPRPGLTWYNGSKGAANLLSKSMAVELAPDRIRVNAIAPVAGETPLLATFMGEDTPEKRKAFTATIPWGRFSTPQDIANAALFLCSDESEMVTGSVLAVDGGRCV
jgi:3-oxoacyl-[acyl-carrier protein] reductase